MAPEVSIRVMVTNVTRWNSALTDNDIEMDSDNCNLSFEFTQILSDAETAKSQYTSFESEMTHLWTIFSMIGNSSMSEVLIRTMPSLLLWGPTEMRRAALWDTELPWLPLSSLLWLFELAQFNITDRYLAASY